MVGGAEGQQGDLLWVGVYVRPKLYDWSSKMQCWQAEGSNQYVSNKVLMTYWKKYNSNVWGTGEKWEHQDKWLDLKLAKFERQLRWVTQSWILEYVAAELESHSRVNN